MTTMIDYGINCPRRGDYSPDCYDCTDARCWRKIKRVCLDKWHHRQNAAQGLPDHATASEQLRSQSSTSDVPNCPDFGEFGKHAHCDGCHRTRGPFNKVACQAETKRRYEMFSSQRAIQASQEKADKEAEAAAELDRQRRLAAARAALPPGVLVDVRELAELRIRHTNRWLSDKLALERLRGQIKPTTQIALDFQIDTLTELTQCIQSSHSQPSPTSSGSSSTGTTSSTRNALDTAAAP